MTQIEALSAFLRAESKRGGLGPINWDLIAERAYKRGYRLNKEQLDGKTNKVKGSKDRT